MLDEKASSMQRARPVMVLVVLLLVGSVGAALVLASNANNDPQNATSSTHLLAPTERVPTTMASPAISASTSHAGAITYIATIATNTPGPGRVAGVAGVLGSRGPADLDDRIAAIDAQNTATAQAIQARKIVEAATASAIQTVIALGGQATPYTDIVTGTKGFVFVPSPDAKPEDTQFAQYTGLVAIAATGANDVWAVGHDGSREGSNMQIIEHWNGKKWSIVPSASRAGYDNCTNCRLSAVTALTIDDAWIVGSQYDWSSPDSHTLAEHWNGKVWSMVSTPYEEKGAYLSGVSAVTANDIWAVGGQSDKKYGSVPFVVHWDGKQWRVIPSPAMNRYGTLQGVAALTSDDVWAVGEYIPVQPRALIEHWDGADWKVVPGADINNLSYGSDPAYLSYPSNPNNDESHLQAISARSKDDIWAVGWRNIVRRVGYEWLPQPGYEGLVEHWDGKQWSIVPDPTNMQTVLTTMTTMTNTQDHVLEGVSALASNDVWAVGFYGPNSNSRWGTLAEHWDGKQWNVVPTPNFHPEAGENGLAAVSAVSSGDVWAVGEYGGYYASNYPGSDIWGLTAHYGQDVVNGPTPAREDSTPTPNSHP
jgi:hypothetical protein